MTTTTDERLLLAYVEESDLHAVAALLRKRFGDFITARKWATSEVVFVDQVQPADPDHPDFLPQWDLGLNLGLDHIPSCPTWFGDIEALARFLRELAGETGCEFVLVLAFRSQPWRQEHLAFVSGNEVDLVGLRQIIERLVGRGS
jgi:hypothetical protein